VLQLFLSVRAGQSFPPFALLVVTLLVLVWVPPPQVLLQLPHEPQLLVAQWTGHPPLLQLLVSVRLLHFFPPKSAAWETERFLVLVPGPQFLLQEE